jgi:hypothetical protein
MNCTQCTVHTSKSLSTSSSTFYIILYSCFDNYFCNCKIKNFSFQITVTFGTNKNLYKMNCKYFVTRQNYCSDWFYHPPNTTFFSYSYCIIVLNLVAFFLWLCDPTQVMASSFTRFLDHTQQRTTAGRTPLDEWSDRRRDLYLTTHNNHNI